MLEKGWKREGDIKMRETRERVCERVQEKKYPDTIPLHGMTHWAMARS